MDKHNVSFFAVIQAAEFRRLAALIRVCDRPAWRDAYPESKFGFYYRNFAQAVEQVAPGDAHAPIRDALLAAYTGMIYEAQQSDPRLTPYVTLEVTRWIEHVLSSETARLTLILLLAQSSMETILLSLADVVEHIGGSAPRWRAKCAAGEIPGARLIGKTWAIPEDYLLYGAEKVTM